VTTSVVHVPEPGQLVDVQLRRYVVVDVVQGTVDLALGHGFHETKQGMRYTISEGARREVLDRLLRLNHERYAEEVALGLHEKGAKNGKSKRSNGKSKGKNGTIGKQRELLFE